MSGGRGGFPWRWAIAAVALGVIALTVLVPPPGAGEEPAGPAEGAAEPEADTAAASPEIGGEPQPALPDTVRMLVLNGTMEDGLAGRTQRYILGAGDIGMTVVAPGEPSDTDWKPYYESVIVSHVRDLTAAREIAGALGLPETRVVWEVREDPEVEVTVCLGQDFAADPPAGL